MSQKLKASLIIGSVRQGRQADKVVKYFKKFIDTRGGFDLTIVDPLEYKINLEDKIFHHYQKDEKIPEQMLKLNKILTESEAYFVMTSEYNHAPQPALLNLMDHFPISTYAYKPSGIITYSAGNFGGTRAAFCLKPFLSELGTNAVSAQAHVSNIFECDEEGNPKDEKAKGYLQFQFTRLVDHVEWFAHAQKNHKEKFGVPK